MSAAADPGARAVHPHDRDAGDHLPEGLAQITLHQHEVEDDTDTVEDVRGDALQRSVPLPRTAIGELTEQRHEEGVGRSEDDRIDQRGDDFKDPARDVNVRLRRADRIPQRVRSRTHRVLPSVPSDGASS